MPVELYKHGSFSGPLIVGQCVSFQFYNDDQLDANLRNIWYFLLGAPPVSKKTVYIWVQIQPIFFFTKALLSCWSSVVSSRMWPTCLRVSTRGAKELQRSRGTTQIPLQGSRCQTWRQLVTTSTTSWPDGCFCNWWWFSFTLKSLRQLITTWASFDIVTYFNSFSR